MAETEGYSLTGKVEPNARRRPYGATGGPPPGGVVKRDPNYIFDHTHPRCPYRPRGKGGLTTTTHTPQRKHVGRAPAEEGTLGIWRRAVTEATWEEEAEESATS